MSEPATKADLQDLKDGTKADLQDLKDGITAEIKELAKSITKRFDNIDERLNNHDKRFDKVETRLDAIEKRTDKRFDKVETRLDAMQTDLTNHIDTNFKTVVQFAKKFDKNRKQDESIENRLKHHTKEIDDLREDVETLKNR